MVLIILELGCQCSGTWESVCHETALEIQTVVAWLTCLYTRVLQKLTLCDKKLPGCRW